MRYLIVFAILALAGCGEGIPVEPSIFTDKESDCQYFVYNTGYTVSITPRLVNGKPFCGSAR